MIAGLGSRKMFVVAQAARVLLVGVLVFVAGWLFGCAGSYTGLELGADTPLSDKEMQAGLRALLPQEELAAYHALPDSQKSEWLRVFWLKHDPTPTTSENEFRVEFFRRMRYVLYYFSNPLGPGPWDDRGEVYVRYGEPNDRTFIVGAYWDRKGALTVGGARAKKLAATPSEEGGGDGSRMRVRDSKPLDDSRETGGEVWHYYRRGLSFQFQDQDGLGIFSLVPSTDTFGKQQEFGEFVRNKITAVDLQPAVYLHDYGTQQLDYALDLARFRAHGKTFDVDVNLGYPLAELARGGPDSATISLRRTVIIRDDSLREVVSDLSVLNRRVGSSGGHQQLLVEQKVFNLPPGAYELAVSIEDLYSGRSGVYKKSFRLPEFVTREVQEISDVELASFVWSVYEPGSPYVKSDRLVMPLPSHVYLQGQPIAFYYEVYNLAYNSRDTAVYRVDYEILDVEAKRVFHKEDAGKFVSPDRDVFQFGSIEKSDLAPGEYLLSINVVDETTRKEKRTLTRFKIVPIASTLKVQD